MEAKGIMYFFYKLSDWIMKLAYVNILWLLFSILGIVLFGFFPATIAMFTIVRKWLSDDEEEFSVFKLFWTTYKQEFFKSNLLGFIITIITYLFYIELNFIENYHNDFLQLFYYPLFILRYVFYLTILFIFPTYVHYDIKFFHLLKNAFLMMLLNPIPTIMMVIGSLIIYFANMYMPIIAVFFSGSVVTLVIMKVALMAFRKIEVKKKNELILED